MISVSDNQLRMVAEAADLLPAEARGTFLRRVVAEVREGRSFNDSDIERAVRMRQNWLSNRIFKSFDNIVDHCCYAWNTLIDQPWKIMSIARRDWTTMGHSM